MGEIKEFRAGRLIESGRSIAKIINCGLDRSCVQEGWAELLLLQLHSALTSVENLFCGPLGKEVVGLASSESFLQVHIVADVDLEDNLATKFFEAPQPCCTESVQHN